MPSQNFVYADVDGNIGYQSPGKIPIRAPGHQGLVPVPGWTGEYEWQGFIPFDELPSVFNPSTGFIATANNKVVPDDYPYHLAYEWAAPYRAQRITDLLAADASITIEDIRDIHAQTYSLPAEALRPYLLAVEPENDLQARALAQVEAWDLYNEADRPGASVYQVWYWFLVQNTLRDELGDDLADDYLSNHYIHVPLMVEMMAQADNPWFDDVTTPQVETRDEIVRRSLADAAAWLSERYGDAPKKWEWGRLHTMTFVHQPLGQSGIGLLENLFNSKTIPARGDNLTVDAASSSFDEPFAVRSGVSQRFIADLSDLGNSVTVHTTGQSGQLFHPHREDFISPWQNVEYHPMLFSREAVEANAEAVLTLSRFYPDVVRPLQQEGQVRNVILTNVKTYLPWLRRTVFRLTRERQEGHRLPAYEAEKVLWWERLMRRTPGDFEPVPVIPDDLAVLLYTGGTTGAPKGVMLSHRNLVANVVQTRVWFADLRGGGETFLGVLPFSHSYGLTACLNVAILGGSAVVLLPTFDTEAVLKAVRRYQPTLFPGVPAMYGAINEFPKVRGYELASVKACISGASPLPIEVQEGFEKLTKGRLVEGYGLTEASPVTHANPLFGLRKVGCIGIPLPSTDARIVHPRTGRELKSGVVGELVIRGPQVMQGYWRRPEETEEALRDGWLHTGDLAEMDGDGYFRIINRIRDLIPVGRRQIYPRDVEEVLYEHPSVQEAAAIGAPGADGRGEVRVHIVLRPGHQATAEEIIAFCQGRLRPSQVPRQVRFREQMPRSFVGKVLRHQLREEELTAAEGR